ncbi:MAG: type II secretion system F family protein [Coriobacteriales bacterium]|jgi:type IV pilus assembly protein PilC|nr:type II secretion system F family protein [Coriobacteriales bacterium]
MSSTKQEQNTNPANPAAKELSPAELGLFFSNLELIYHSGLTPAEGFDILRQSTSDAPTKKWLEQLYQFSLMGLPLTDSLEKAGRLPDYALSLLRIGEETGRLEDTCRSLHEYYERRDELAQALRSALVYPSTMILMVFVVVIILLTQAMPVFDQVFSQLGFELTGVAGALLAAGQALRSSALYLSAALAAIVIIALILRALPAGRRVFSALYERAPITSELSFKLALQRFAFAMATMLRSGLDTDAALQLAEPLIENAKASERVRTIRAKVGQGMGFQTAIEESKLFPLEEMSLLVVGFKTGSDAQAFDQVGTSIAVATERRLDRLVGAIEPTLVGLMCVLVGVILLSVMLPLLGVLSTI